MDTQTTPIDPLDALRTLTPEQIERRLAEIDGERTALSTLLRSIRARDRARRRHEPRQEAVR
jgi:hypothetical protein